MTKKGRYQTIGTFNSSPARVVVAEELFSLDWDADEYIHHEFKLTVGHSKPLTLRLWEIGCVIDVLEKARTLVRRREEEIARNDALATASL